MCPTLLSGDSEFHVFTLSRQIFPQNGKVDLKLYYDLDPSTITSF